MAHAAQAAVVHACGSARWRAGRARRQAEGWFAGQVDGRQGCRAESGGATARQTPVADQHIQQADQQLLPPTHL